jgi:hypothetical protein
MPLNEIELALKPGKCMVNFSSKVVFMLTQSEKRRSRLDHSRSSYLHFFVLVKVDDLSVALKVSSFLNGSLDVDEQNKVQPNRAKFRLRIILDVLTDVSETNVVIWEGFKAKFRKLYSKVEKRREVTVMKGGDWSASRLHV